MKITSILFIIVLTIPLINATHISEINFLKPEFIEIYSNQSLNFTNATLQDENPGLLNLSLIQKKNSKLYLIVGTDFLSENNISKLNCSIYSTRLSEPGKYGLKNSGENVTLNFLNLTLNFSKTKDYSFQTNQSLNYNFKNNSYFISNKTPCELQNISFQTNENILNSSINQTSNVTLNLNNSNLSQDNLTNISNLNLSSNQTQINSSDINLNNTIKNSTACNYAFSINPIKNITTDKIRFDFITNSTNFTIRYWIDDFNNTTVKSSLNTTNKNIKQYTPKDYTNIYIIKAILKTSKCALNDSKSVIYYSKTNSYLKSQIDSQQNSTSNIVIQNHSTKSVQTNFKPNSEIKILNKKSIINGSNKFISYFAYKGSDTLKRSIYFHINGKKIYSFQLKKYENTSGKVAFNSTSGFNQINISGLDIENIINFTLKNKTQINNSPNLNYSNNSSPTIKNSSQIQNISNTNNSLKFQIIKTQKLSNTISTHFIQNNAKTYLKNISKINSSKKQQVFISNNQKIKQKSFYPIFLGVSTMLSTLIFLW